MGEVAARIKLHGQGEVLRGLLPLSLPVVRQTHAFVCQRQVRIQAQRFLEQRAGLGRALHVQVKVSAPRGGFGRRQHTSDVVFLRDLSPHFYQGIVEAGLAHVRLEVLLEPFQVPEGLPGCLQRVDVVLQQANIIRQGRRLAHLLIEHQIVRQCPGFGIEDRRLIRFVVIGRAMVHLEQHLEGEQLVFPEQPHAGFTGQSQFQLFFPNGGIAIELRKPFIEPHWNAAGVEVLEDVHIFVINDVERIFPFSVEPQRNVMLFLA